MAPINELDIHVSQILRVEIDRISISLVFIYCVTRLRLFSLHTIISMKLMILLRLYYNRYCSLVLMMDLLISFVGIVIVVLLV